MPVAWLKWMIRFLADWMSVGRPEPVTARWLPVPVRVDTGRVRLPVRRREREVLLPRMVLTRGGGGWRP